MGKISLKKLIVNKFSYLGIHSSLHEIYQPGKA